MRSSILLSAVFLAAACNSGHAEEGGPQAQRAFEAGAFDKIALSGSPDVIVTVGGPPSIRAEGEARELERLEIVAENGQLRIGMRDRSNWFSFGSHRGVTVHITVPALAAASVGGSGDIRIDRVQGSSFAASVAGSGDIDVATLAVQEASFSVTGSGGIKAAGRAGRANAAVAGSGDLDLARLETANATAAVAGSGNISMRATDTARVELRGSGDIRIAGTARCMVSKTGSGDVRCGG